MQEYFITFHPYVQTDNDEIRFMIASRDFTSPNPQHIIRSVYPSLFHLHAGKAKQLSLRASYQFCFGSGQHNNFICVYLELQQCFAHNGKGKTILL